MAYSEQDIYEDIAYEVATQMAIIQDKYRHHPVLVANALISAAGCYIAMVAGNPEAALASFAEKLKATDVDDVKHRLFGAKLGVDQDGKAGEPAKVINIGPTKGKPT